MVDVVGRGDDPPALAQDPRQLADAAIEVRHVEEDPRRDDTVELAVAKRQLLEIADIRVDPAAPRELDHPRRDVDGRELDAQLGSDARSQLPRPAADFEDTPRRELCDRVEHRLGRVHPFCVLVGRAPYLEAVLCRVLAADELRIVELHGSTIGWPGIPRVGALPPSHRLIVAPTSANSPAWMWPFAFLPSTYASSSAYSREWSVEGVVGSQPWSEVRTSRSWSRRVSSRSGSRRSKSCRQRWKLSGSLRWPQSMSVSTRLVKISPSSISRSSVSVCRIPSMFDCVGRDSSMSWPAKMSPIFPTPCTVLPASR